MAFRWQSNQGSCTGVAERYKEELGIQRGFFVLIHVRNRQHSSDLDQAEVQWFLVVKATSSWPCERAAALVLVLPKDTKSNQTFGQDS